MTPTQFRRIALGLAGVVEGAHMGHPDFRVNGRIFATLTADERRGMVQLPLDHQERVVRDNPDVFVPASGAWGRQGSTMVELKPADVESVGAAITIAWQHRVATHAARLKPSRSKTNAERTRAVKKKAPVPRRR
jgi:hypothetical protein